MKAPFFNSWKTSLAGILFVGIAVCKYFKVDLPYDEIISLLAGISLGFSKDYNVTGNNVTNNENNNK